MLMVGKSSFVVCIVGPKFVWPCGMFLLGANVMH
jgi:hypothetical protein